jgi:ubiquinone/menaquinone biosynthesis C-methylase UbiE
MEPVRDPEQIEPKYLSRIEELSDARVIEIGCGNGRLTWRYASLVDSVIGIDPEADALREAIDARPLEGCLRFDAVRALAERLPLKAESFDAALFSWSL